MSYSSGGAAHTHSLIATSAVQFKGQAWLEGCNFSQFCALGTYEEQFDKIVITFFKKHCYSFSNVEALNVRMENAFFSPLKLFL